MVIIFSAGIDSPVSMASSTFNSIVLNSLRSAGTLEPDESKTISPGTSSRLFISFVMPSLNTLALGTIIFFNALTLSSALNSWMYPIIALRSTTAIMTPVSMYSLRRNVTIAAIRRI